MITQYLLDQNRYMSLIGIGVILLVAFLFSNNKRRVSVRLVVTALCMQFALAFVILRTALGQTLFAGLAEGFNALYAFAEQGGMFLFGKLADKTGPWGFVFAIKLIPMIIFTSLLDIGARETFEILAKDQMLDQRLFSSCIQISFVHSATPTQRMPTGIR